ncbi:MAG: helix-turn-helix domain-containing protein [bacterium]
MNPSTNETEALLTVKEVAKRWNMCTKTIRRYVDQGLLKQVRFSARCIRYRASEVAAVLATMSGENRRAS